MSRRRAAAVAVAGLIVAVFDVAVAMHGVRRLPDDFAVYRMGGAAVLHGQPLYQVTEPAGGLGFTYPVFAAVLFTPLAVLPPAVAFLTVLVVNTALFALAWRMVRRALPLGRTSSPLLFALGWLCEPVASTVASGQVNLLLAVLLLADMVVLRRSRWHGAATGLAAGIKITPALFALLFLFTRQWRAFGLSVVAFLGTAAVGFLLRPAESQAYWTHGLFDTSRVGSESALSNQSLVGLLARAAGHPAVPGVVVVGVATLVLGCCLPLLRRLHRQGQHLTLAAVGGVVTVLISPIAWSHHWVWLPLLALCVWRPRSPWGWPAAVALVLAVDARWLAATLGTAAWRHSLVGEALANSFPALAAGLLLLAGFTTVGLARRGRSLRAGEP